MNDYMNDLNIKTKRLLIRTLSLSDAPSVFAYASDEEVTRHVTWLPHMTIKDSEIFIQSSLDAMKEKEQPGPYAIALVDSPDKVIGTIGGFWKSRLNECMEIGYAIGRTYRGQGFATEAVKALTKHIFNEYKVIRLQALTTVDNGASGKVLLKSGFLFEGILRKYQYIHGVARDMNMYSFIKSAVESKRAVETSSDGEPKSGLAGCETWLTVERGQSEK